MEIFPAADEEQLAFIKKIIDDSDYYVLILGGRYGSVSAQGISYTECEYDYAIEQRKHVLAFVHPAPADLPLEKRDTEPGLEQKLAKFREKVRSGRLVKEWRSCADLPGLVAVAMQRAIRVYPSTGWVRSSGKEEKDLLRQINEIRTENEQLKSEIAELKRNARPVQLPFKLADLDETTTIAYSYRHNGRKYTKTASPSWRYLFKCISPIILTQPNDAKAIDAIGRRMFEVYSPDSSGYDPRLATESADLIRAHFDASGLVRVRLLNTTNGSQALFWSLTPKGHALMTELLASPTDRAT